MLSEQIGLSDLDDGARMSNRRPRVPTSRSCTKSRPHDRPNRANEAFALTTRRFGNDAFACGEVDATNRDRLLVFTLDGEGWRKFYLKSFLRREPMLAAACSLSN